jgi:polar amino acid transport system substrate-binding protein
LLWRYNVSILNLKFPRKIKAAGRSAAIFAAAGLGLACGARAEPVAIPNFWDAKARLERPDLTGLRTVRFMVDDDFPPLLLLGPDGNPTGFSVELARAACERLAITCTVQVRRFDTLLKALEDRNGDVVAAAVPITADLREKFGVTSPYFRIPARFTARKGFPDTEVRGNSLKGRTIAVVQGTAHEAFVQSFMTGAAIKRFPELAAAQAGLKNGEADVLFADGLSSALWIGGTAAADCCTFVGGAFLDSRYFGEGIGFITRKDDDLLRRAFDYALQRLWDEGKYAELYLRFFPVSPF